MNSSLKAWLVGALLLVFFILYYAQAAMRLPAVLTVDSYANDAAIEYLIQHKRIPVVRADDDAIVFTSLGTTRSTRPPLTYIVGASVAAVLEPYMQSATARQRMGGVLIGAFTVLASYLGFLLFFKRIAYALLGAWLLALMPQFTLLATSNNDDIGAIFSVTIVFVAALAATQYRDQLWPFFVAAFGFGLILQSKFTGWLCLPIFLIYFAMQARDNAGKVIQSMPFLMLLMVGSGAWWVIFNMTHYGILDPTALGQATELQREIKGVEPSARGYASMGVSLYSLLTNFDGFITTTVKSAVGYIPWIGLEIGFFGYAIYGLVFSAALIRMIMRIFFMRHRQLPSFDLAVLFAFAIQIAFYVHHNWMRDIQPHGRYLLPLVVPMIYLALCLFRELIPRAARVFVGLREVFVERVVVALWMIIVIAAHGFAMERYLNF